jgi:hypothetical protein
MWRHFTEATSCGALDERVERVSYSKALAPIAPNDTVRPSLPSAQQGTRRRHIDGSSIGRIA